MLSQLTNDPQALRLFFTDDIYLVDEPEAVTYAGTGEQNHQEYVSLVKEPEPVSLAAARPEFKFLGNNKRNILILVNDEQNEVSDEKGRELLRKIVKSMNLTANDFALLNYANYKSTSLAQLNTHFSCTLVFAFGVTPLHLGLNDHPENTVVNEGAVKLIFSAELKTLEADQQAKKVLWGSLQQLGL
ncbi:MAG TPA: hypothetical protein VKB19_13595 [Pedobacter sp.]|nr:hypothetical protein [Pedobacter sp.]